MADRVYVYIDGANFVYGCQDELGRADVDFVAFVKKLVGDRAHGRTYYYNAPLSAEHPEEKRRKQQRFYGALKYKPYFEVRLGRLVKRDWTCDNCNATVEKWIEKGVDMRLGVNMVGHASRDLYDVAILVSGDGDFTDAVQAVKDLGKHVEVACFSSSRSDALLTVSDFMHDLKPDFFSDLYLS